MSAVPRGLPGPLPAGERMLWQGAPDWRLLARRALHTRKLVLYFGLITVWVGACRLLEGAAPSDALRAVAWAAFIGTAPILLAFAYAWAAARASVYTITDRRLVLQLGLALPVTINLPFTRIASADLNRRADGSGDISVSLLGGDRLSYAVLWPHVRPRRFGHPQPTLRALPDVQPVAQLLARALAASADMAAPVLEGQPKAETAAPHAAMAA